MWTHLVLTTEPDTERGQAVYDVRVLAPNHATYVAHVSRATGAVLRTSRTESQGAGNVAASGTPEPAKSAPADRPDAGDRSPDLTTDHGDHGRGDRNGDQNSRDSRDHGDRGDYGTQQDG